jgi:16S rRNA (guanine527-N7)-methyltransferase
MISNEEQARDYVAGLTDADGLERIERFAALVLAENQHQNLIAKATEPHLWQRHIADSAQLLENVSRETLLGAKASSPATLAPQSAPWATHMRFALWRRVRTR